MKLHADARIAPQRRVAIVVEGRTRWLPDETQIRVSEKDIEQHDRGAKRLPPGQDVEIFPGLSVLALDEFLDDLVNFASVSAEVVAQVDDETPGLQLVHLGEVLS